MGRGGVFTQASSTVWRLLAMAALALGCSDCKRGDPAAAMDAGADADEVAVTEPIGNPETDAGAAAPATVKVAALVSPAPIFTAPEWPPKDPTRAAEERMGVYRIGYLRKGAIVDVKPALLKKANCPEGWFQLVGGGFLCGKFATLDLNHKDLATAPHPPLAEGPLPYEYGLNLTNGTPLYRRPPHKRERKQFEAGLAVGKSIKDSDKPSVVRTSAPKEATAGESEGDAPAPAAPVNAGAATAANGEKPWYLKEHHGARPQISLDELKGESGLVDHRMVRGFYLALDKQVNTYAGSFWRTTRGLLTPKDHILVHKSKTDFEGILFPPAAAPGQPGQPGEPPPPAEPGGRPTHLPVAFVLGLHAHKVRFTDSNGEKKLHRGDKLERFTMVSLTGNKVRYDNRDFYETDEGWYIRDLDSTETRPGKPPSDLAPGEKWIDVNLSTQTLVAFEGDKPYFATLISSGRHDDTDKTKDHRTVSGSFRIREKHVAATMDHDNSTDGPYSIEDVPWIMYFEQSFALHGAFWHSAFGHERSHGCVNLQPHDAKVLFQWVGPRLPDGWHGIRATDENPGTRVIVHD
jgi:hypothetical protein